MIQEGRRGRQILGPGLWALSFPSDNGSWVEKANNGLWALDFRPSNNEF